MQDTTARAGSRGQPPHVCPKLCILIKPMFCFLHRMYGPEKGQDGGDILATGCCGQFVGWVGRADLTRPMQLQNWLCGGRVQHRHNGSHLYTALEGLPKKEQSWLSRQPLLQYHTTQSFLLCLLCLLSCQLSAGAQDECLQVSLCMGTLSGGHLGF